MADKKLSEKVQKISSAIEALTVVEVAELAKYLENKFGVTAMPTVSSSAAAPAGEEKAQEEEKSTFTVVLSASGDNKLAVIKAVRELNQSLGLMEAKKLVESAPYDLLKDVKKEQAEEAKKKLETAGAKVELQ